MREPLDMVKDHSVKEMHWLWSPGGGKTTAIEGAIQWKMANDPCNTLVIGQKDDTAERWMETRFLPSVRKNDELKEKLPSAKGKDRHKLRKTTVIFNDGFYLEAGGSAESNLQEKSMPLVIFDEAWKTSQHPGRIQQGKQRTHDKWNSLILFAGQAGETHNDPERDDAYCDLYREWRKTDQRTFCFECPECQTVQPFKWERMKWEKTEIEGYGTDWTKTGETVRMTCCNQECNAEFPDDIKTRRILSESGRYMPMNHHAEKGYVGFHANALCYWRIPWVKMVQQFDEAMDAKYRGDLTLLEVFVKQRLAEFWTPVSYEVQTELVAGGYTVAGYEDGKLIDAEESRAIGVDVQQNSMWYTVGAMTAEGVLQILDCGEALTVQEIEDKRIKYKVPKSCVLVDCQYRRDYVFQTCSTHGWTAYRGVPQDSFNITVKGKPVKAPYSHLIPVQSGSGAKTSVINFCVNQIKDVVAELRAGRMGRLLVPDDIDPRFKEHLNAEVKRKVISGRENKETELWVRIGKRDNHMLDNVMALVGLMMVKRLIRTNNEE